jgi:hypothetical protein
MRKMSPKHLETKDVSTFKTPHVKCWGGNDDPVSLMAEIPCAIRLITQSHESLTSMNRQANAREVGNQDAEHDSCPCRIDSEISGARVGPVGNLSLGELFWLSSPSGTWSQLVWRDAEGCSKDEARETRFAQLSKDDQISTRLNTGWMKSPETQKRLIRMSQPKLNLVLRLGPSACEKASITAVSRADSSEEAKSHFLTVVTDYVQ